MQDAGYGEKSLFAPDDDNEEETQTKIEDEVNGPSGFIQPLDYNRSFFLTCDQSYHSLRHGTNCIMVSAVGCVVLSSGLIAVLFYLDTGDSFGPS